MAQATVSPAKYYFFYYLEDGDIKLLRNLITKLSINNFTLTRCLGLSLNPLLPYVMQPIFPPTYSLSDTRKQEGKIFPELVLSVQQKLSGLKFSKFWTGSHVMYSCHHNSSRFTFPYLCIRCVSLYSIHYNQSRRVFINQRHQYICLIWG